MTAPSTPSAPIAAHWYNGRSSQPLAVLVTLEPTGTGQGPGLAIHPLQAADTPALRLHHRDVDWPEAWSPRRPPPRVVVDLRDHGSLEIDDPTAWHRAVQAAGQRTSLAHRMQTRWPVLLGVLAVTLFALIAFYRYGTPWMASQLTRWVPLSWETELSHQALMELDERLLQPSKLPAERQAALRQRFDALQTQLPTQQLRYPHYAPPYQLQFRRGMGANAFALPGGTIVMTDGMVEAAQKHQISDDGLVGVLAHEIGHVAQRHTTRMVVEQGVLNVGLGLALGDVSSLIASGSTLLTGLAYQRNHEREADCFAMAVLQRAQLPTAPLGTLLLAISREQKKEKADTTPATKSPMDGLWSLAQTHPDTETRAEALRTGHAPHCAAP